jgi:uncharacterized protein YyaL (SSP411 family)
LTRIVDGDPWRCGRPECPPDNDLGPAGRLRRWNRHCVTAPTDPVRPANRLAGEKSPYLLQHAHNPVDWYPWGDAGFDRAQAANKPIFLSIGYSTCHWCHVMERESFTDETVAALLNAHFVSIKVDREERPDVDRAYMTFVQATVGQGGWPLNVFLTPDLKPFFGGTYFPPQPRHHLPGFPDLLRQIAGLWQQRRTEIVHSAADILGRLAEATVRPPQPGIVLDRALLDRAADHCGAEYDPRHGGFGAAPKFPRPCLPAFLLEHAVRGGHPETVRKVLHTCERMAAGGIHDQLGGGFARYAVDAEWLVPHFEKMLYDNAQLAQLYLDAFAVSGDPGHAAVARDILDYVLRDMTHPEGGFYSAEDADSEGKEGKFYCWTRSEIETLLAPEERDLIVRCYGITERGNFVDHSDPDPLPGQNVLSVVDSDLSVADRSRFDAARAKLLAHRNRRVRPHLDDKILSSWNGLMLGAFARAAVVLGEPRYLEAARRNLEFLRRRLWDPATRTLYHRWRDGERDDVQLLDAYAFLLSGVIEFYQVTLDPNVLNLALDLAEAMIARFHDPEAGGFWHSPPGTPNLVLQFKEDYDGAEPSGNAVAILSLLQLGAIAGRTDFRAVADRGLRLFARRLERQPEAVPHLLRGLDFALEEPCRVVLAGTAGDPRLLALIAAAHRPYRPGKVVLGTHGPVDAFAQTLPPRNGQPTAYVCTGTACQPPVTEASDLAELLRQAPPQTDGTRFGGACCLV